MACFSNYLGALSKIVSYIKWFGYLRSQLVHMTMHIEYSNTHSNLSCGLVNYSLVNLYPAPPPCVLSE